ncbi:MAG TPA: aldehyde dehydrogenase family protein, partial [Thermomicrobiales bacterium]|nr:aldehyde dehydrogenase family protein [Thermomicrobiales bacterium]
MSATADKITYTATAEQVAAMHDAFDQALADIQGELGATHPMIIDGQDRTAAETFAVVAPADHEMVIGRFQHGTRQDVADAVAAARAAFPVWSSRPWQERVAIMKRAAEIIRERKFRLAALL